MKIAKGLIILLLLFTPVNTTLARVTPEDIINSKQSAYQQKLKNYQPTNQLKLENKSKQIAMLNHQLVNVLENNINLQAAVLDEYEKRMKGKNTQKIVQARYLLTFAHEAVAFQKAKIYIFGLRDESNIGQDMSLTISLFQTEMLYARSKVVDSQILIKGLVNENKI